MENHGHPAADDVALSALIDDELDKADAEIICARLATDDKLAHRLLAMIHATAVIRAAYADALEVVGVVAAIYGRTIRDDDTIARSAAGLAGEQILVRNVDVAVARLTPAQRIPLCLAVLENLSYVEIATALHVPDRAVMTRLAEARAALAESLGEDLLARVDTASMTRH